MSELDSLFSAQGVFAQTIPGYRLRPQQLEMAEAILQAIRAQDKLVVEAGTGTGKTLAYLAPALLSGGKVVISTGTKTLQDQLFDLRGKQIPPRANTHGAVILSRSAARQGTGELRAPRPCRWLNRK